MTRIRELTKITSIVAERVPLVEARRAHENLDRRGLTGKRGSP